MFLWCVGTSDPALARYVVCTQETAFEIADMGAAPEKDGCAAAMARWINRKVTVFARDEEVLRITCEVPR